MGGGEEGGAERFTKRSDREFRRDVAGDERAGDQVSIYQDFLTGALIVLLFLTSDFKSVVAACYRGL